MAFEFKYRGSFKGAIPGLSTFLSPLDVVGSLLGLAIPLANAATLLIEGFKTIVELILLPLLFLLGAVSNVTAFLSTMLQGLETAFNSLAANLEFELDEASFNGPANLFPTSLTNYFMTGNSQLVQSSTIYNDTTVQATVVVIAYIANSVKVSLGQALSGLFPPFVAPTLAAHAGTSTIPPGKYYVRYAYFNIDTETFASPSTAVTTTAALPVVAVSFGTNGVGAYVYMGSDQYTMQRVATVFPGSGDQVSVTLQALPLNGAPAVILDPAEDAFKPPTNNIPNTITFVTNGVFGVTWKSPFTTSDLYTVVLSMQDPITMAYRSLHEYDVTESGNLHSLPLNDYVKETGSYKITITTTTGSASAEIGYVAPSYFTPNSGNIGADSAANTLDLTFSTQRDSAHLVLVQLYDRSDPTTVIGVVTPTPSLTGFNQTLNTTFTPVPTAPGAVPLVDGSTYFVTITDLGPPPSDMSIPTAGPQSEVLTLPDFAYALQVPLSGDFTDTVPTMSDLQEQKVAGIFHFLSSVTQILVGLFNQLTSLLNSFNSSIGALSQRQLGMQLMIKSFEDQVDNIKKVIDDLQKFLSMLLKFKIALSASFNFGDVYVFKYSGPLNEFGASTIAQFTAGLPGTSSPSTVMGAELFIGTSTGARAFLDLLFGA